MTLRRWLFDVTPPGSTLNTGSVVSTDGANATAGATGVGGTFTSSDTEVHLGATSARFVGGGTGADSSYLIRLPLVAANYMGALSLYHFGVALNSIDVINVRHASGQLFRIGISAIGSVQIKTGAGTVIASTDSGAWQIDRWNRIEVKWDNSGGATAGIAEVAVYDGDSLTPAGTVSTAAGNLGSAPATTVDIGSPNSGSYTDAYYFDSVQMNDGATSFIGPYVEVNEPPAVTSGGAQTVAEAATVALAFSVTDIDGTIASRATVFDYPASGGPTISDGATNSPSFTAGAAPQLYVVRHSATDDDGGVGFATTEVRVPTAGSGTSLPAAMDAVEATGAWTLEGDADTDGEALADGDDATYVESDAISAVVQEITVRLLPRNALASGVVTVRLSTDTDTATATVRLRRGATVLQEWVQEVDDAPTDYLFTLSGTAVTGANLDPGDLRISVAVAS